MMARPMPHDVIARSQLWGIRCIAVLHGLLAPLTVLIGSAFVGLMLIVIRARSLDDALTQPPFFSGIYYSFLVPGGLMGEPGLLAILCNPFLVLSGVAALGLWLRRGWGRWVAIGLSFFCVLQTMVSFTYNAVMLLGQASHPDEYAFSALVLAAPLLPLLWYGPVVWYLTRPRIAAVFSGGSGDCATP
jgi:hypothetical protein